MPLPEFLQGVRRADHGVQSQLGLGQKMWSDQAEMDRILRGAAWWMSPANVNGYDPAELTGLKPQVVEAVTAAVERFRTVADRVSNDQPPTEEEFHVALEALTTICDSLEIRLSDPASDNVYSAIRTVLSTPEYGLLGTGLGFDFELRADAGGEPAVVVWLVAPDHIDVTSADFQVRMRRVRQALRQEFARRGIDRWPFVRVHSVSEARATPVAVG